MPISDITTRGPILKAIAEFDSIGQEPFLAKYGFRPARAYWLNYDGRSYNSKAIVGVACRYVPGSKSALRPDEFFGGSRTVAPLLRRLGFTVEVHKIENEDRNTEIQRLAWMRTNQARFSDPVKEAWGQKCAVTGIETPVLLEACHIKPWSGSDDHERRNSFNGVCLASHVHALFDAHLLGFRGTGGLCISPHLASKDRRLMRLGEEITVAFSEGYRPYLEYRFRQYLEANSDEQ